MIYLQQSANVTRIKCGAGHLVGPASSLMCHYRMNRGFPPVESCTYSNYGGWGPEIRQSGHNRGPPGLDGTQSGPYGTQSFQRFHCCSTPNNNNKSFSGIFETPFHSFKWAKWLGGTRCGLAPAFSYPQSPTCSPTLYANLLILHVYHRMLETVG